MGWGGFLDKLLSKLPIQNREERWRNEIDNLRKEKENLISSTWNEKKGIRLEVINKRIDYLIQLLKNNNK